MAKRWLLPVMTSLCLGGTAEAGKLHVCGEDTKVTAVAAVDSVSDEGKDITLGTAPASTGDCDVAYVHSETPIPPTCEEGARITASGKVRYEDGEGTLYAESLKCEPLKTLLSDDCQEGATVRLEAKVRQVVREIQKGGLIATDDPNVFKIPQSYTLDDKAYLHLAEPASVKPCPASVLVFTKGPPPQNCGAGDHVSASGRITAFVGDGGQVTMALVLDADPECRK
jgi:hypothetical protein